jgi:flagella basal body P-ring formation protein FlgA
VRTLALLLLTAALALGQAPAPAGATAPASVEALVDAALVFAKKTAAETGGSYRFQLVQPPRLPLLSPGKVTFEASHLSKRDPVGRFFVVVAVKVDGQRAATVRVDLDGAWLGQVLRAKQDLARRTELTLDQVEATLFEGVPPEGALSELPAGQRLRGPLAGGRILTRGDLEPIPLVQSGDKVRLTGTSEALTISLDTVARSQGGLGDHVRLEAPGSRRTVVAVVTGPGEARLGN